MKLMIVEDDKALAKGIELALSEKENEITVCYDLKTAEEMWESENADLVILDVNLPDGSGYDFLAFVKESSKVPVILLTANDLEIDQVTGFHSVQMIILPNHLVWRCFVQGLKCRNAGFGNSVKIRV